MQQRTNANTMSQ